MIKSSLGIAVWTQAAQTHVTREGCNLSKGLCSQSKNIRDFVWKIYYSDLRTQNNAKPYFFFNEMNRKDLLAKYSTTFWCLFVVLLVFFGFIA